MYLLLLNYIKPLEDIDRLVQEHIEFLDRHYETGNFICSGRQHPRTGGVILCNASNQDEVENIINADPFTREKAAVYTIIEFTPSKYAVGFEQFISVAGDTSGCCS